MRQATGPLIVCSSKSENRFDSPVVDLRGFFLFQRAEHGFELGGCFDFGDLLDGGNLAGEAFKRRLVDLAFAVGLFAIVVGAFQVAQNLGDRDRVAGIDLHFVLLCAARPHSAAYTGAALKGFHSVFQTVAGAELAQARCAGLDNRNFEAHTVFFKADGVQADFGAADDSGFNTFNLANTMSGVNHVVALGEVLIVVAGHIFFILCYWLFFHVLAFAFKSFQS